MKKISKFAALTLAICAAFSLSAGIAAENVDIPAQAAAALTGRTQESITEEQRKTGKSLGAIVSEAGKLEEFHTAVYEMRAGQLDQLVAAGRITRAQAESALAGFQDRQAICDGTGCNGTDCGMVCSGQNSCTLKDCPNEHGAAGYPAGCGGMRGQGRGCRRS